MAPNLPPSITVNRNLAATLKNYIKANGGKNVSEAELNTILQKVAKFDAERDSGAREGGSIFSGGSKYLGGSGNDFVVKQGQQIQLSAEEFNEIFKGFIDPIKTQDTPIQTKPIDMAPLETPEIKPEPAKLPDKLDAPKDLKKPETEALLDTVDGKIIERQVNGKKQKISVATVNGEKVRRAVNEDGTLGETLVTVSTAGKNKYITQSEMDKRMRAALGLADNEEIPKDIKGEFVNIGGVPTLIFKKDGKTMDNSQLQEYISNIHTKHNGNAGDIKDEQVDTQADIKPTPASDNPENNPAVRDKKPSRTGGKKLNNRQLERYLAKDTSYQEYNNYINKLNTSMKALEDEYKFHRGDLLGSLNMPSEKWEKYAEMELLYKMQSPMLEKYKDEMANWKDGSLGENSVVKRTINGSTQTWTNLERITLTNGEHAWKSNEGVFYPYIDGGIGSKAVPEELLPKE